MTEPPQGTVTFLFTDIEGSTKLWDTDSERMRGVLARHDALLRAAITAAGGYVFKTIGDAFCAAFATAPKALDAVVAAQRALFAEPWPEEMPLKVRMALHTGAVESRDGDYFGPPVNRVARLLAVAHGGQTVLSRVTVDLVRDSILPGVELRDLGAHPLKDLARPEQVFQLCHPELPADFPMLRSLATQPNNLPQQVTSFIGREAEAAALRDLLERSRLVTLHGTGGTGKTRLSLQVAADVLERFPDGAWFVELAPLSDPALTARALADALGVRELPGQPILGTVAEYLRTRDLLLILDNCEHLLAEAARVADQLLRQCPRVRILASSREALGIAGEQTFRVPSLSLPDPDAARSVESLAHYEAVRLFIDRARLARADFVVTNESAPALASTCLRLDGIPLAIELAAARVRSLSVEEIESRLDQRFRLLTGGSRTALPRQQTLRALVDWSWDLLGEAERTLLRRVSVFAGGWTLEAAEAICADETLEDWEVLDLLLSLSDKSLLTLDQSRAATRYGLLETVRQYAVDRLDQSGESAVLRDRHLAYLADWAEGIAPELHGPGMLLALERLEAEQDNVRAALRWASEAASENGARLIFAIDYFWLLRSRVREGARFAEALASALDGRVSDGALCRARISQARMRFCLSDWDGARATLAAADACAARIADPEIDAQIASLSGVIAFAVGDLDAAERHTRRAIDHYTRRGDRRRVASLQMNLSELSQGEERAALLRDALSVFEALGDLRLSSAALGNLGATVESLGDYGEAKSLAQRALVLRHRVGEAAGVSASLDFIGRALVLGSDSDADARAAARLFGAARRVSDDIGLPSETAPEIVASLKLRLTPDAYEAEVDAGYRMPRDEAIALAIAL